MKKLLLFAALVLGMASCQTEPEGLDVVVGGEQEVMLSVSLPESTRSKSSAGFDFTEFEKNSDYDLRFILEISHNGKVDRTVNVSKTTSTTFPIRLAPERDYTFTVWADIVEENSQEDLYYNILTPDANGVVPGLSNITIKEWTPNVELRDAYTFTTTKEFKAGATDLTMTLERPFAKVRVVATDIEDVTKFDIVPDKATVTYTVDMYTKYNAVGVNKGASEVDQNVSITYPIDVNAYEDEKENGQLTELTVFADYIFVPADGIIKFDLVINDGDAKIKENYFNTAIPVVANKVTSIVGDVLTHGGNVSINVNNGINQNETINYVDSATTLQEIINNTQAGESANITLGGDIDLNDLLTAGTLSTRAGEAAGLVIPANKTVVIDLKGYTISYSTDTWNKHMIENNGDLTLKGEGTVAFTFTGDADTSHGKGNYAVVNNGTLIIEGATVSAKASKVAEGEKFSHALYAIQMSKGAMTLESGSIINYNGYAVRQFGASDITVNGGMVKGTRALWIQLPGSDASVAPAVNVTVNGGTLIGTGETDYKLAIYSYSYGNDMANVNIAVKGGTIEGDIALTGGKNKTNIETLTITGGTLCDVYSYGEEKAAAEAITIKGGTFSSIAPLAYLNAADEVVTLNSNVENAAPVKFAGEGTLNLNGHNVTAVDTTEVGYGLITNNGNLTITGEGKMTLSATIDSGWSRYSSVISNGPNGTLTVNEDVTIEHIGGTSMAYGIDVLTNGNIGDSHATVYGTVKSKYRAIRQFLNSDVKMNTLIVKEGANVESTGGNKAIWMQDPSKKANTGKLVVESGAKVHSVYLDVTEGSTEWPVEVSVAASSLTDQSENKGIYTDNIPAGYAVVNENGIWTVSYTCAAKIGETEYKSLKAAFEAVKDGDTITLARDIIFDENSRQSSGGTWYEGLYYIGNKSFTVDLNGKTISQNGAVNDYLFLFKNDTNTENTINFINGTLDAGTSAYCALCTSTTSSAKITINLENVNLNGNNSNGAVAKIRGGAELNVKAGTIITGADSYVGIEAFGATVNIYEGAKIYQNGKSSYAGSLVGVSGNGTVNVYGGEGTSAQGGFIAMTSGGTINVSGGNWIANTNGTYANDNKGVLIAQSSKGAKSVINVTGGTFKGGYNCYGDAVGDAQINIKGGNFNANPANYVANDDYTVVENNGVYTVGLKPVIAKIGQTEYRVLQKAFDEVVDNGTIDLQDNVTLNAPVVLAAGKTATLNLNNKQIVNTNASENYGESEGIIVYGNLTIEGEGTIQGASMAVWARGGNGDAVINIKGGTFKGCQEDLAEGGRAVIYASSNNVVNIYGGEFKALAADKTSFAASQYPVLNVADNKGMINVYGGRFHNQNPAAPGTEPAAWNAAHPYGFVAEGYGATENNGVWTVAKAYDITEEGATIYSAAGMFWFANEVNVNKNAFNGKTVTLANDIDLKNAAWTPVGQTGATTFNGVFDGQNYTIYNLNVNSEAQTGKHYSSGLFGWVESHTAGHGHLKNVKINGATINGHHNCGALVGYITQETALVENCHVTGATVTCTKANDDADGDKAGALIGNATVATPVKDCTAANSTVSAGRDAGQIIGAGKEVNVTGCSATNVTVSANGTGTGANVRNEVIGRLL